MIFLTSGEKGGHGYSEEETTTIREEEAKAAACILQTSESDFWREPDGGFTPGENSVKRLVKKINSFMPDVVYVPHDDEVHPDHKGAALLVREAVMQSKETKRPIVWMYEVWTPIQNIDHIVDITPYVEIKRKAIHAHKSQCDVMKFDEAILGLNRYRGEMHSWPGGDYAEVFGRLKVD